MTPKPVIDKSQLPNPTANALSVRVSIDALEQRDNWRAGWRFFAHDGVLALLCVGLLLATLAYYLLPQSPFDSTADALGFSQWQAQARALTNGAFTLLQDLGLFDIVHAGWVRLCLVALLGVVLLRLADRVSHFWLGRSGTGHSGTGTNTEQLHDETRVHVTDHAPSLLVIAERLRRRHYRVMLDPHSPNQPRWLNADRAPRAELFSILMHTGLLVAAFGMYANILWGWNDQHIPISSEIPIVLPTQRFNLQLLAANDPPNTVKVQIDDQVPQILALPATLQASGMLAAVSSQQFLLQPLVLNVAEITPEFRVSATAADKSALPLIISSYASAQSEAVLTFRSGETERALAIGPEPAKLALLISPTERKPESTNALGIVQAFALPSGRVITETAIRPNLVIEGVYINIAPSYGAVIAARYQPGNVWVCFGALIALLAWLGCWRYPMQRIVARLYAPDWTEFYASGRWVMQIIHEVTG
ncbi:MAG: cytochrome c biogenesis protein ResB [Chloroflexi bacterium]|nr:cytochrome c biogenesis protein ResB [Chloroflexota bacterium]